MKSLFALMIALAISSSAAADDTQSVPFEELNWKEPPGELLSQKYCPMDSSADAMTVQKEMEFYFLKGDLNVISRRRVKIYTDKGLSYAEFKEYYNDGINIDSISACSYDTSGNKTELSLKDIHDEVLIKSEKGGIREASKSFAVPNVKAGSVVDVIIHSIYLHSITPPVFRFHEDIPVEIARFIMNPNSSDYYSFDYKYVLTNRELILPLSYMHGGDFVCEAKRIPAVENEPYPLPKRNLVTDLWINIRGFTLFNYHIDFAGTWGSLLDGYGKAYDRAYESSKKAKKLADSLMTVTSDPKERIRLAYNIVRDRWNNVRLPYVGAIPDEINDLMKRNTLDPEDKALVLWAILKHMGIESEVVWVCSDNSYYTPMTDVPSRLMFDYALTWIPSDSLFLDPGDPGGEVGALDEAFSERVMCRPTALDSFISITPKIEKTSGILANLKLTLADDGSISGQGTVAFNNQAAIEARRIFRKEGVEDAKSKLDQLLFRGNKKAVKSFTLAADSLQTPELFTVSCDLAIPDFFEPDDPDFDLAIYPGPTYDTTTIDFNPPRKYPIYLKAKSRNVYMIEWNLGNLYHPASIDGLSQSVDMLLVSYKMLVGYDSTQGALTVRRQDNRSQKLCEPRFAPSFEQYLKGAKKCDQTAVTLVKE